jgi:putative DNA methylase
LINDRQAPQKLNEVALPLDDINAAAAREKSIRHGHASTLHLWWARWLLAVARAVLFAQMVNDPGGERGWGATRARPRRMPSASARVCSKSCASW